MKSLKPGGIFDPDKLKSEANQLEAETSSDGFWQNRENAEKVLTNLKRLKNRYEPWEKLKNDFDELQEIWTLAVEEKDPSLQKEADGNLYSLQKHYDSLRVMEYLSDEADNSAAFLTVHSGAGGTESCDWASMLFRMYSRWAERRGFSIETIDLLEAEGGIKSVTAEITGDFAFGFLKGEVGVHRLVRISPFDANSRRHTSFASVLVTPVLDDSIEIDIKPEDLRIDTYRSSGAGGQHVNKTDSAVRLTHLATNIVVQCQNERSQHKNKAMAMKILRSKLYDYYKSEQDKENEKFSGDKKEISWGNQIRSYTFQPYTLVKDHRTKAEMGNIQAVMDGEIDNFIEEYLKYSWSERNSK